MQTITITIKAETIYIADNILREKAMMNKCFPVGVTKTKQNTYVGTMVKR
jgi:hypothetical protein